MLPSAFGPALGAGHHSCGMYFSSYILYFDFTSFAIGLISESQAHVRVLLEMIQIITARSYVACTVSMVRIPNISPIKCQKPIVRMLLCLHHLVCTRYRCSSLAVPQWRAPEEVYVTLPAPLRNSGVNNNLFYPYSSAVALIHGFRRTKLDALQTVYAYTCDTPSPY
jgi:hypothetical protein